MFYADGQRFAAAQLGLDKEARLSDILGIAKNTLRGTLPALTREEKVRRAASRALAEAPLPAQDAARMRAAAQRAETGRLPEGWSLSHDAVTPRHISEQILPKPPAAMPQARRLKAAEVTSCSTNKASTPPSVSSVFSKLARLQCRHNSLNNPSSPHRPRHLRQPEAPASWVDGLDRFKSSAMRASFSKIGKARSLSRRITFRGLNISIETDKGELRHWHDPHSGEKGSTKMIYPYGYIRRTEGVDGDHVDVYVGPNEDAKNVYVVHQMKAPDFKKYDEDKCMLGFDNADAAKKAYLAHFNDNRFFGSMSVMPFEEFKNKALATFEEPKKIAQRDDEIPYTGAAGALGAASVPFAGYLGPRIKASPFHGKGLQLAGMPFENLEGLAQPGDVVVTGPIGKRTLQHSFEEAISGTPYTHAEIVVPGRIPSMPNTRSLDELAKPLFNLDRESTDIALLRSRRPVDPTVVDAASRSAVHGRRYDMGKGVAAGARDVLLPKIPGITDCIHGGTGTRVCSTTPALALEQATGKTTIPGVHPHSTTPGHFPRGEFDLIAHTSPGTAIERAARARKLFHKGLALRAAAAIPLAGLGYLAADSPESAGALTAGTAGGLAIPWAVRKALGKEHFRTMVPLSYGARFLRGASEKAKNIRGNMLRRTVPLTLASAAVPALAAYLGLRDKTAANPLLGRTTSTVRRAVRAGDVHKAHDVARLGIRTGVVEPPMLQRYTTVGAGVTPHEAELWRIASRSAQQPLRKTAALPSISMETRGDRLADQAVDTAGTVGLMTAIPAAGLAYGAHRGLKAHPNYRLVEPGISEAAKNFMSLADAKNIPANEFVQRYVQHAGQLSRNPAITIPGGPTLTGAEASLRLRSEGVPGRISELLTGKPFTEGSRKHYQAFTKGPIASYAQLANEAYEHGVRAPRIGQGEHRFAGRGGLSHDFVTTVGEARYEAAQQLAAQRTLTPARFQRQFAEILQRKMPEAAPKDVARLAQSIEEQLLQNAPDTYRAHLDAIRGGQDATHLQNELLAKSRLNPEGRTNANLVMRKLRRLAKQQRIKGPVSRLSIEAQQKLLEQVLQTNDPVLQLANLRIQQGWRDAPRQYGTLIRPLQKYQKVHQDIGKLLQKLRRGGMWGMALGGGLAAAPFVASAFDSTATPKLRQG